MKLEYCVTPYSTLAEHDYHWRIAEWLPKALRMRVESSPAFIQAYGDDWLLSFDYGGYIKRKKGKFPIVREPFVNRREKLLIWKIIIAWIGNESLDAKAYRVPMRQFLEGIAIALKRVGLDTSKLSKDLPALVDEFCSIPKVIPRETDDDFETDSLDVSDYSTPTYSNYSKDESSPQALAQMENSQKIGETSRGGRRMGNGTICTAPLVGHARS